MSEGLGFPAQHQSIHPSNPFPSSSFFLHSIFSAASKALTHEQGWGTPIFEFGIDSVRRDSFCFLPLVNSVHLGHEMIIGDSVYASFRAGRGDLETWAGEGACLSKSRDFLVDAIGAARFIPAARLLVQAGIFCIFLNPKAFWRMESKVLGIRSLGLILDVSLSPGVSGRSFPKG